VGFGGVWWSLIRGERHGNFSREGKETLFLCSGVDEFGCAVKDLDGEMMLWELGLNSEDLM
jgi:hypothetical protein